MNSDVIPERQGEVYLSAYERDNLLAALEAIAHYAGPHRALDTGDWVMSVAVKLGWCGDLTDRGSPNVSAEAMASQAQEWA